MFQFPHTLLFTQTVPLFRQSRHLAFQQNDAHHLVGKPVAFLPQGNDVRL